MRGAARCFRLSCYMRALMFFAAYFFNELRYDIRAAAYVTIMARHVAALPLISSMRPRNVPLRHAAFDIADDTPLFDCYAKGVYTLCHAAPQMPPLLHLICAIC